MDMKTLVTSFSNIIRLKTLILNRRKGIAIIYNWIIFFFLLLCCRSPYNNVKTVLNRKSSGIIPFQYSPPLYILFSKLFFFFTFYNSLYGFIHANYIIIITLTIICICMLKYTHTHILYLTRWETILFLLTFTTYNHY